MAIQIAKVVNAYGKDLIFNAAYLRIEEMKISKNQAEVSICIYSDSTVTTRIETLNYRVDLNVSKESLNYHTQVYEYLKTKEQYQNAIDV